MFILKKVDIIENNKKAPNITLGITGIFTSSRINLNIRIPKTVMPNIIYEIGCCQDWEKNRNNTNDSKSQ